MSLNISRRIKRFVVGGIILGIMALPVIGCADTSDMGNVGSAIDNVNAQATQTAKLPNVMHNLNSNTIYCGQYPVGQEPAGCK
jgi:outer membrane murein-binding lipoprotein Lpp